MLDLGLAAAAAHGSGAGGQALTRAAALLTFGAEWRPVERLGLRLDAAIGWQLLSGTLQLGGQKLSGSEPRGFRGELAGGINVDVAGSFGLFARGGLALDGVYPQSLQSSLQPNGFLNLGVQFSL